MTAINFHELTCLTWSNNGELSAVDHELLMQRLVEASNIEPKFAESVAAPAGAEANG